MCAVALTGCKVGRACGTAETVIDNIPASAQQGIVTGLSPGEHFFWVTAFDTSGNESANSACVVALIPDDVDTVSPGNPANPACTFVVTVPRGSAFQGQCVATP